MARKRKTDEPDLEQGHMEGMAPPRIKAIDQAAKVYYGVMTERVALSKEEDEAKDALIDEMHKADLKYYECFDGKVVTLTEKTGLKIKPKKLQEGEKDSTDD
jgi:hypothetical protein